MLLTHTGRSFGSDTDLIPTDERLTIAADVPWYVLLRDGKYKYVRTLVKGEMEEVYDLVTDPEELNNIALDPSQSDLVSKLRQTAISELRDTNAKFIDSLPPTIADR